MQNEHLESFVRSFAHGCSFFCIEVVNPSPVIGLHVTSSNSFMIQSPYSSYVKLNVSAVRKFVFAGNVLPPWRRPDPANRGEHQMRLHHSALHNLLCECQCSWDDLVPTSAIPMFSRHPIST